VWCDILSEVLLAKRADSQQRHDPTRTHLQLLLGFVRRKLRYIYLSFFQLFIKLVYFARSICMKEKQMFHSTKDIQQKISNKTNPYEFTTLPNPTGTKQNKIK